MVDAIGSLKRLGERRRAPERFRIVERRGGFDRRAGRGMLLILRDNPMLLLGLLVLLNLLSAADWALTMHAFDHGAIEGNPVLASIIAALPLAAAVFKASVILGVSIALWSGRRHRLLLATAVVGVAVYALLAVYHIGAIAIAGAL